MPSTFHYCILLKMFLKHPGDNSFTLLTSKSIALKQGSSIQSFTKRALARVSKWKMPQSSIHSTNSTCGNLDGTVRYRQKNPRFSTWLVVSTPLKNMSQNGNLPQIGMKYTKSWNHHLEINDVQFRTTFPRNLRIGAVFEATEKWH